MAMTGHLSLDWARSSKKAGRIITDESKETDVRLYRNSSSRFSGIRV